MINSKTILFCLMVVFSIPFVELTGSLNAQSIFERRSPNQVDLYSNFAARRKGDLLSVIIDESTDVENRDERSLDKTGRSAIAGDLTYGLGGDLGGANATGSIDQNSSTTRNFSGDSEFRSARQFIDRFSCTVVDVLPNGNLLIQGHRSISVQGDSRTLRLTGVVRQIDVLPGNRVSSNLVANLKIQLEGKGPEQKFNKQGWLGRKANRFWPF